MPKINRYNGNLQAFASAAPGTERTIFGDVTQSDDLTAQFTADFLRGWGIVGPSDQPTMEDFNAAMYTHGQLLAYLHQIGVAEWNATQEYHAGSIASISGVLYYSLVNSNTGNAPVTSPAQWTRLNKKNETRFASSGSFTVPAGVTQLIISGSAGGGGGGGSFSIGATGNIAAGGGGGGAGQSIVRQAYTVTPGQVIAITIGAGGLAGAVAGNGGPGGATSAAGLVTLTGGGGGGPGAAGVSSSSWAGGVGGAGFPAGSDAADATANYTSSSGAGAASPFGGGGGSRRGTSVAGLAGTPAGGFGGGGGGGGGTYSGAVTSPGSSGGAGTPGILVIEW